MTNGHFVNCIKPHDCWCEVNIYLIAFGIGLAILAVQIVGGIFSGSLALLADSGHVFIDEIVLAFTVITAWLVKIHRHHEEKIRMMGGYVNGFLFFFIGGWIAIEALDRMNNPITVDGTIMAAFALIGGLGNLAQHQVVEQRSEDHTVTQRSAKWHILSDMFQSIAVVLGALTIMLTGFVQIDVWISFAISALMFWWGIRTLILSMSKRAKKYHGHHHHHH